MRGENQATEELEPIARRAWTVLVVCSAATALTLLDSGTVFVAFPFIEEQFEDQVSRRTLSWAVTMFFVVMVATLLVAGRVADRFGRKRIYLGGLAAFGVGAAIAATTTDVWVLIGARALQGLGVGMLSPSALALALPEFPNSRRAYALGVLGTIGAITGLAASPLGAVLVELFGWRGVFGFTGALALVVLAVGSVVLDDAADRSDPGPIDLLSAVLAMIAVGSLALVLVQGGDWGWTSRSTVAAAALCLVTAGLFQRRNSSRPAPLVSPGLFRNRRFAVASVASVCAQLGFFSSYFGLPLYMGEVWDWSPLRIGLALLPLNLPPVLAAVPAGRIVDRRGPRDMMAIGGIFAAVWYLAMGFWLTEAGYVWLAAGMALSSLGALAIGNSTTVAALYDIDDDELGAANAGYFTTRRLGSALGAVAVSAIVGNRTGADFADVFLWVWIFGAAVYLVGGVAAWRWYPQVEREAT